MKWSEVSARRLARHHLIRPAEDAAATEVVAAMCGAHAQVMSAAELSVALRLRGLTRAGVREALWQERSLVKTLGPRGTVHLLPTRDLPMWTGALAEVPARGLQPDGVRLTSEQSEQVIAAIATALGEAELTVDELSEAVVELAGSWAGDPVVPAFQGMWPRWRQAMHLAAFRGVLCFGPNRGRKVTYTNPRRWSPGFEPQEPRAALAGVVKAYLHSYGPATPKAFARWFAAPDGWAGRVFESLAGELERVEVEGTAAWVVAGDTAMPSEAPAGVRLLPYFDAFGVGCHPRERLFPGRAAERALSGNQAGNYPVLLIDGTVAGVWHQRRSGRRIEVTVEPLRELSGENLGELEEQVARVGEILEGTARLTVGTVTVGAHA